MPISRRAAASCNYRTRPDRRRRPGLDRDRSALEDRTLLATFTVINTLDDANAGSLRWAIGQVDADTGTAVDSIRFAIPGTGPFTITSPMGLPTITHSVVIDGYSQPGSSRNTSAQADNASLNIVLNGANKGNDGLTLSAGGSVVTGLVIQQFRYAIHLTGAGGDVVSGNFIGTDASGNTALGNLEGVLVDGSNGNTIGGTTPDSRNVVSANLDENIDLIHGSTGNLIEGNLVGLNASGTALIANAIDANGIIVEGSPGNTIGGTTAAARNVVAGQYLAGIDENGSDRTLIEGNYSGTDVTGTVALPNGVGISQYATSVGDTIGGTVAGAGNLVSGNTRQGINAEGGVLIEGNLVGTDVTGTKALGNRGAGVQVGNSASTVGGTAAGAGNVISANAIGILFDPTNRLGNLVVGNLIGTDSTGTYPLGNASDGIRFEGSSGVNTVGGTTAASGNLIAYNGGAGVGMLAQPGSQTGVEVVGNSIHDNAGLGIDLGDDGVTPNTPGGPHVGPNGLQNTPVLGAVATYNGQTFIQGTINSTPNGVFTLQFYSDPTADPSGHGQGQAYLGLATVTADPSGNASFLEAFPVVVPAGQVLTATATDRSGDTSEFAADLPVVASSLPIYAQSDTYFADEGNSLVVSAPGVQSNDISATGQTFTSSVVSQPSQGTLSPNPDGSFTYTPEAGFSGVDSFTYDDIQGSVTSNVATVTIVVIPRNLVVTNTNDSGAGSLRQAILTADESTGANTESILFNIPGTGPFTIAPQSALPTLTEPTLVDGESQPGVELNSLAKGDNAAILIAIQGGGAGAYDGLVIAGGRSIVRGLQIGGFNAGVQIIDNGSDTIAGNSLTGNLSYGLDVEGVPSNVVGGAAPALRNVISSDGNSGVFLNNSANDMIRGNYVGTDASGSALTHSQNYGVTLYNSPNATIGGTAAGQGNLFSNNATAGLYIEYGSNFATVQGNLIGTDPGGTKAVPNGNGINSSVGDLLVGGTVAGSGNVISGNSGTGVSLALYLAPTNDTVEGNLIGVDITGVRTLGNSGFGVEIQGDNPETVAGNVISGNGSYGIYCLTSGIFGSVIRGNKIGTDAAGKLALGNLGGGIYIASYGVQVGGTSVGQGNIISANGGEGVTIRGDNGASDLNILQGNEIGTDGSGTAALGNAGYGIDILHQAAKNQIGGTVAGAGNVIADNRLAGVVIVSDSVADDDNSILSNAIYGNGELGIDLNNDGVTPNHVGGPIPGSNDAQNFPVLTSASVVGGNTLASGTLNGAASTSYTIQFFASPAADPTGYGQGRTLVGSTTIKTDPSGNAAYSATLVANLAPGQFVTATATDPDGNTSEFAKDVRALAITQATLSLSRAAAIYKQSITFVASVAATPGLAMPTGMVTFLDYSTVLGTATLDATGHARFSTSALLLGTQSITAVYAGDPINASSNSPATSLYVGDLPKDDFDGDGKADLAVFGVIPATGRYGFTILTSSSNNKTTVAFDNNGFGYGNAGSIPVVGDYFGDGKAAYALWTANNVGGMTFSAVSLVSSRSVNVNFGQVTDIPVVADVDGDGKADFGVYGYLPGHGYAFDFLLSSTGFNVNRQSIFDNNGYGYGNARSIPVVADFDGTGKAGFGLYNPATTGSSFTYIDPANNYSFTRTIGTASDVPAAVEYDGDGKADLALYGPDPARAGHYRYLVLTSGSGFAPAQAVTFDNFGFGYGNQSSIPVIADYEGTGRADFGLFTPDFAGGMNFVYQASQTGAGVVVNFPTTVELPLTASPFLLAKKVRGH